MADLLLLPDDQQTRYFALCSRGWALWRDERNPADAEAHFLRAWAIIPDPKMDYDETSSFLTGMVDFLKETRQLDKAFAWLPLLAECYGIDNPHSQFKTAEIHFLAGQFDAAFALFDQLYKAWGRRPFAGENPDCLAFYKERRGRRTTARRGADRED